MTKTKFRLFADLKYATLYLRSNDNSVKIKEVLDINGDAYGFYNDTIKSTGWNVLEIRAGYGTKKKTDLEIMFVAGYLEGYLTAHHIRDHFENMYSQMIKDQYVLEKVHMFLQKQDEWVRREVRIHGNETLWRHAGLLMAQMDGLYAGAAQRSTWSFEKPLSYFEIQFLNAVGDLLDLIPMMFPTYEADWHTLNLARQYRRRWYMGHCSALIKVLPGNENVFFGHSSWFTYAAMLRVYKHLNFNIKDSECSNSMMSFSSYPGFLESLDDFYILSSGLVVLQTTNAIYNMSLFKDVVPYSLLAWQRVRIANMMADSGKVWGEIFSRHNSGTYNNQYMILDLKKVDIKQTINDEALYVVEQVPNLVLYSDQTNILREGYWASYNIPFHEIIYNISGYPEMVKVHGKDLLYNMAARARIFQRDHWKVTDLKSMQYILRYNNFQNEPFADGDPCKTICCREDLSLKAPIPAGCYDTKVSDIYMAKTFQSSVISGPTVEDGLPPFRWSKFNDTIHQGLPEKVNFAFVFMKPTL
ncbi:phospholipase B-like 1 [Pelodytes ibericus]